MPSPHVPLVQVLQGLGPRRVRAVFAEACGAGTMAYLVHEGAAVGPVRVFGSPYARWGSHNDAFLGDPDFSAVPPGTHVLVTHMPPVKPKAGGQSEDPRAVGALLRCGGLLSVSGHCHWAHGVYHTAAGRVPCAVASASGSKWLPATSLHPGPAGRRGDPTDRHHGGYNVAHHPIVCDLAVPGGPPCPQARWRLDAEAAPSPPAERAASAAAQEEGPRAAPVGAELTEGPHAVATREMVQRSARAQSAEAALALGRQADASGAHGQQRQSTQHGLPPLLFFGPPNDPGTAARLQPQLAADFVVHHFEDAEVVYCCGALWRAVGVLSLRRAIWGTILEQTQYI